MLNRSVLYCIASAFLVVGLAVGSARGDLPNLGDVHLLIDLTDDGAMTLQPNNAKLAGFSIYEPQSQIVPDTDRAVPFPFERCNLHVFSEHIYCNFGAATLLTEDLLLDITFGGDRAQAQNVVFQYTRAGQVSPVDGLIHIVPEPAMLGLLALGGFLVLPHRRRSA